MSDFAVSTAFKAKDYISKAFGNMSKGADLFGNHADKAFRRASRGGNKFSGVVKGILAATAIQKGVEGLKNGVGGIIFQAAKLENATIDFKTLTGSMDTAVKTVNDLRSTAASTPFEFGDLSAATKTLLGFEAVSQKDLIPTLRMIGDTAGGSADRFNGITLAFSQIKASGKASLQDINQLINNGVPILGTLADQWGVNVARAREMVTAGKATGGVVTAAFKAMTSEGGKFYNGMENASKTLTGRWSTLMDNIKIASATIGTALLPKVKDGVDSAIQIAKRINTWAMANQELIKQKFGQFVDDLSNGLENGFRKAVPIIWETFKAIKTLYRVIKSFAPILPIIIGGMLAYSAAMKVGVLFKFVQGIKSAVVAQGLLNAVMAMNPIGFVIAGITALVAIGVLVVKHWDKVKAVFKRVWDALDIPIIRNLALVFAPFMAIPALIIKNWSSIKTFFSGLLSKIMKIVKPIVKDIGLMFQPLLKIPDIIKTAWQPIKDFFLSIFQAINKVTSKFDVVNKLKRVFGDGSGVRLNQEQKLIPPNRAKEQARIKSSEKILRAMQEIEFKGQLNIEGAPEGSKFRAKTIGASPIKTELLGANA